MLATLGDAGNHLGGDAGVEVSCGKIIEKEQRLGTLNHQIIHAHRHQIDANGGVLVCLDGDFKLGSHTVGCGDQERIGIAGGFGVENAAESAEPASHAGTRRCRGEGTNDIDQRFAGGDIDAGVFIGQ